VISHLEEEKTSRAHAQAERTTLMQEEITTQTVEVPTNNVAQMKEKSKELTEKFHDLDKAV
jgi:hypothetical protein